MLLCGRQRIRGASSPSAVGCGTASDPDCGLPFDFLFADVEFSIGGPWRALEVDQAGCPFESCRGYTIRKMKPGSTGDDDELVRSCVRFEGAAESPDLRADGPFLLRDFSMHAAGGRAGLHERTQDEAVEKRRPPSSRTASARRTT